MLDGNFVLMDIAAAQSAFDRFGRLDRIDVLLAPGREVAVDLTAIAARLPAGLAAQRPSRRGEQVERMLAAFHMNLTALSWIALIVGLFLVYNTVTISVVARREEIGTLRALGVSRRQVVALFLGEAAALALAGIVLGLGLARVLADAAVALTAATVSTLYIATAAVPPEMDGESRRAGRGYRACRWRCWRPRCPRSRRPACRRRRPCAVTTSSTRASDFAGASSCSRSLLLALAAFLATRGPSQRPARLRLSARRW